MKNEMNKEMTKQEFQVFGNEKQWDLKEFPTYAQGWNDEKDGDTHNPYTQNTLAYWLYDAGVYDAWTN